MRSTLIIGRSSRLLPGAELHYCMQACIHFNRSMDELLTMVLINDGERSGEAHQLVSEILQYLAAMGTWHFFNFVALVTDY